MYHPLFWFGGGDLPTETPPERTWEQESIPVGCVPPAFLILGGGGLPSPKEYGNRQPDRKWHHTETPLWTDTCEIITLPQTSFAGGNNGLTCLKSESDSRLSSRQRFPWQDFSDFHLSTLPVWSWAGLIGSCFPRSDFLTSGKLCRVHLLASEI